MKRFLDWIENTLMPPMASLAEQKHLKAIREGVISTLSLILIGSLFLIIAQLPIPGYAEWVTPLVPKLMLPYRVTMGLMTIYATYGMGYSLARSYKLDGITGGVLSLAAFLTLTIPINVTPMLVEGSAPLGWVLPMGYLGGQGMFSGILSMIFAVEVLRLFKTKNWTIRMPEQVPESVARSFEALIPGTIILSVFWFLRVILDFDINLLLVSIFTPITNLLGNNVFGAMIPVLFIHLLWAAGVHGMSVIGSIVRPMWLMMLDENVAALASGAPATQLPYVTPEQFYQWFVYIGGSGATLSLCLLLLMSKSSYLKQVGRFSIVPGIFNINEPLIFGIPLIMNPVLAIPFILVPLITTATAYFAVSLGLVNGLVVNATWTLPAPIGAFLATGNDWRAIILVLVNMVIGGLIYYPFIKVYDKKMLEEETTSQTA